MQPKDERPVRLASARRRRRRGAGSGEYHVSASLARVLRPLQRFWSTARRDPTAVLLVVANIVPVVDLVRRGEPMGAILVIYWMQLVIIGLWNIPKLIIVARWLALVAVPGFALMYGMVLGIFGFIAGGLLDDQMQGTAWQKDFSPWNYSLPAIVFFVVHGASFFMNYVGRREWNEHDVQRQMMVPMFRVMPMWVAATVGAVFGSFFNNAAIAAAFVIPVKVLFDVRGHMVEHDSPHHYRQKNS
jgi:hypothetical protein